MKKTEDVIKEMYLIQYGNSEIYALCKDYVELERIHAGEIKQGRKRAFKILLAQEIKVEIETRPLPTVQ